MSQMQPERDAPPLPIPAEDPKADINKTRLLSASSGEICDLAVILPQLVMLSALRKFCI
jgi:hypothetical protein